MVGIRFVLWCICFPTWPQIMYITVIQRKLFSLLLTYHRPSFPEPSHLSYCCDLTHSTFHVSLSSSFTSRSGSSCTSLPPCAFTSHPWRALPAFSSIQILHIPNSRSISLMYKGPCGSDGKESAYSSGDPGSIPGLGRSPGEGNGYPLEYMIEMHSDALLSGCISTI